MAHVEQALVGSTYQVTPSCQTWQVDKATSLEVLEVTGISPVCPSVVKVFTLEQEGLVAKVFTLEQEVSVARDFTLEQERLAAKDFTLEQEGLVEKDFTLEEVRMAQSDLHMKTHPGIMKGLMLNWNETV